jgi:predicted nucleotidyltransferase
MITPRTASDRHLAFVGQAIAVLSHDERIVGVAAAGSWADDNMDDFSDIDLLIAVETAGFEEVIRDRKRIADSLGPLLAAFTGEHVGEPRLLICLFGPPALHVDLKFVSIEDAGQRVEEPAVLWQRGERLSEAFSAVKSIYPLPDRQWIEDRFWVWVHYAATKIARGELFEVIEFVSFLRTTVFGPLALLQAGGKPTGVRRIETAAPDFASALRTTVATYDVMRCFDAVDRCVALYRSLRGDAIERHHAAETEAVRYLDAQRASFVCRGAN